MSRRRKTQLAQLGPARPEGGVYGVEFDGERIWCATGKAVVALDPSTGESTRRFAVGSQGGTAFDGRYLYQVDGAVIRKLDPESGDELGCIPAPDGSASGMVWAEGSLWVGRYRDKRIHRIDPDTGEVLATLETRRFVTGVTFLEGELWHGAHADDPPSGEPDFELHRVDPEGGALLEQVPVEAPILTGMSPDGDGGLICGGGDEATLQRLSLEPA